MEQRTFTRNYTNISKLNCEVTEVILYHLESPGLEVCLYHLESPTKW